MIFTYPSYCVQFAPTNYRSGTRGFGGPISPSVHSSKPTRRLRSIRAPPDWRAANKLGRHSPRRVAVQALMFHGGASARLVRAEQCRGHTVRSFLDLSDGDRRAIADILIEVSGDGLLDTAVSRPPPGIAGLHFAPDVRSKRGLLGRSELRIEVHLGLLVREHGSIPCGPPTLPAVLSFPSVARS